jgi:hypothetical protein
LGPETALLIEDETDLLLFPPLRAGWAREGEPAKVLLTGRNERRVVFGSMDLRTGRRVFVAREHGRSPDFQVLLESVRGQQGERPVAMLLDEDPCHTAKASVSLAEELDIQLVWLPKRAPELNPMDTLWGHAKDHISANRQYKTIDEQVERFVGYLESLTDHKALRLAGVLSHRFWLRSALSKNYLGPA